VRAKGASLKATEQPIDTSTAAGKRHREGRGRWGLQGPARVDYVTKVRQLKAQGMGASEIAKALKISRASVYRALGERGKPRVESRQTSR
jgi:DNA invertase Pin-like site-specific DNA recombinase